MSDLSSLRNAADHLYKLKNFQNAFCVYDEIYRQIWSALGNVQNGITGFSRDYLQNNVMGSIEFKNLYTSRVADSLFLKWFNMDSDQTLNEFQFATMGHLKCICSSKEIIEKFSSAIVLNEFIVLQTLIIHTADEKWITYLLKNFTPVVEDNRFKKLRPNMQIHRLNSVLIESAEKIRFTDWDFLNDLLLYYLNQTGDSKSELFRYLKNFAEPIREKQNSNYNYSGSKYYGSGKKYQNFGGKNRFNPRTASEEEKAKYYGKILGLEGIVTKSQIREKYLSVISQYHPDRVQSMGDELIQLAEQKTKEINEAYNWLKIKFNL